MRNRPTSFGDFKCAHCGVIVCAEHLLSGVNNRNHCPYCLWSRHLDLYAAGDRLSACKGPMRPVGLTVKHTRNKYAAGGGELMLVHECVECGRLSINRIAADDDAPNLFEVFGTSTALPARTRNLYQQNGITLLATENTPQVQSQLFGSNFNLPETVLVTA
jgi:hypothetical protein